MQIAKKLPLISVPPKQLWSVFFEGGKAVKARASHLSIFIGREVVVAVVLLAAL